MIRGNGTEFDPAATIATAGKMIGSINTPEMVEAVNLMLGLVEKPTPQTEDRCGELTWGLSVRTPEADAYLQADAVRLGARVALEGVRNSDYAESPELNWLLLLRGSIQSTLRGIPGRRRLGSNDLGLRAYARLEGTELISWLLNPRTESGKDVQSARAVRAALDQAVGLGVVGRMYTPPKFKLSSSRSK